MKLITIGSSSAGNCYLLQGERETLIVEAGVHPSHVKIALRWDMTAVVGVLTSHAHLDHSKYLKDFMKLGVPVLGLAETLAACGVADNHFARPVVPERGYRVGGFKIIPFSLEHDVPTVGYHIHHPEMGNLLFVTDTCAMDCRFDGLNHILIEANYDDDILDENIRNGSMPGVMRPRLLKSHLELDSVKAILAAQDLSQVHNVVLLHMSSTNGDPVLFSKEITAVTGIPVKIAQKGSTFNLDRRNI